MVILFIKNRGFDLGVWGQFLASFLCFFSKKHGGNWEDFSPSERSTSLSRPLFWGFGQKPGVWAGVLVKVSERWGFWPKGVTFVTPFHAFYFWRNFFVIFSFLKKWPKNSLSKNCFATIWPKTPRPPVGALSVHPGLRLSFLGFFGFWPKRDICVQVATKNPSGHHRRVSALFGQKVGDGSGVFWGPLFSSSFWGQKGAERLWFVYQGRFFWVPFLAKNPEFIFGQFLVKNLINFWSIFWPKIGQKNGPIFGPFLAKNWSKNGPIFGPFFGPFFGKNPVSGAFLGQKGIKMGQFLAQFLGHFLAQKLVKKWVNFWAIF